MFVSGSTKGGGVAEAIIRLSWNLLPKKHRVFLSNKLMSAQARTELEIPRSKVIVYAESRELQVRFQEFLAPDVTAASSADLEPCSLIMTCYNESGSIIAFLDSVLRQSAPPEQIVICDGGSSDNTAEHIRRWYQSKKEPKFTLTILEGERVSIAEGRNRAVAAATHDILLLTDAGVVLDRNWAERLRRPFLVKPETEVVMGWYRPLTDTAFTEAISRYIVPRLEAVQPETFLPSARSLALRKGVFQAVGGYPEHLSRSGEDSLFDWYIKTVTEHVAFVPEAFCLWRVPNGVRSLFRTIAGYAQGDAESGILFWRYYLRLLYSFLAIGIEVAVAVIVLLIALVTKSTILGIVSLLFYGLALNRSIRLGLGYAPFSEAQSLKERILSLAAIKLMVIAQACGFLRGYRLRAKAEHRRIIKAEKGHAVVLSAEVPKYEPQSPTIQRIQALLGEGWYVTVLYPLPEKDVVVFAHPQLETYTRSAFRLHDWHEKHRRYLSDPLREFIYIDFDKDGLSQELAGQLEQLGAAQGE